MKPKAWIVLIFAGALAACGSVPRAGTAGATSETTGSTPSQAALPEEAILILAPGNGSRLVGQVHVEGIADSTFEQTLVIQVVRLGEGDPQVLVQQPVMIQAELGQRGPFAAEIPFVFDGAAEQPGEVRVFATSARDGGVTHLAAAHVTLASSGESDIRPAEAHAERIVITSPVVTEVVVGGTAHVAGIGLASFEQNLVVELYDAEGQLIGSAATTVSAAEYGVPGPFAVDVAYTLGAAGPGRVVVRDPSPAFGQTLHLASVEVRIEP